MFDRFLLSEFSYRTARRTLARLPVLKNRVWSTGLQEIYPYKPPRSFERSLTFKHGASKNKKLLARFLKAIAAPIVTIEQKSVKFSGTESDCSESGKNRIKWRGERNKGGNPRRITIPTRCAYPECGGKKMQVRQTVVKRLRDTG